MGYQGVPALVGGWEKATNWGEGRKNSVGSIGDRRMAGGRGPLFWDESGMRLDEERERASVGILPVLLSGTASGLASESRWAPLGLGTGKEQVV